MRDLRPSRRPPDRPKPKVKRLRVALILSGLSVLAGISTVFGMMMAVAAQLPRLENQAEYRAARNSVLLADGTNPTQIAKLTGNQNRILLGESDISPNVEAAVIAIEDRRFYDHEGVDYRGIARALWQDILGGGALQGGSTITQQFVKNATVAQGDRTVFQKLREAALAYHLERQWSKQKVLTQYLNTVYFGSGAYGIESAVRTYFGGGRRTYGPNERMARTVTPGQAALLAGMIASPTAYDPVQNPEAARKRRDLVLRRMLDEGLISGEDHRAALQEALPVEDEVTPPQSDSRSPYYSSWLTQQLIDRYGSGRVFGGGLRIKTTLDYQLQRRAEEAVQGRLADAGPSGSLVAIENRTGEVKAMVGGPNFADKPFNLATNGHRQPGSAFKPFTLVAALQSGFKPSDTFSSKLKLYDVPNSADPHEKFVVRNYQGQYLGVATLAEATAESDNSIYAEVGLKVGTRKIARLANRMGIRTRISTNQAMTLGGLEQGVTPLEMTFAYSTIANRGARVSGSLASSRMGPVALEEVRDGKKVVDRNETRVERVFPRSVGDQTRELLRGVVLQGTGTKAQLGEFAAGKTGTTENYGDAWFCGFTKDLTACVWVGYPEGLKPMKTEYGGAPVAGNSYPVEIWHEFMAAAIQLRNEREAARNGTPIVPPTTDPGPVGSDSSASDGVGSEGDSSSSDETGDSGYDGSDDSESGYSPGSPSDPDPSPPQSPSYSSPPTPAPAPQPSPQSGSGGGTAPSGTE